MQYKLTTKGCNINSPKRDVVQTHHKVRCQKLTTKEGIRNSPQRDVLQTYHKGRYQKFATKKGNENSPQMEVNDKQNWPQRELSLTNHRGGG